ncbi:LOW QUALITY PROTEIN: protein suppressor of white apricot [Lucilia sericata]|uniref:LOW QUALITY PROTEIN: protein suppressor of white apricot n=1 Tax=Lucilia sericata TaxID=13632 RepID=UPI0018A81CE0|nr:LOW QUALITY PROTEIN: protein suppressor of white apricot [Lucilia sericata]
MPFNARHTYNTRHDHNTTHGNTGGIGSSSLNTANAASNSSNTVNGILRKVNGSMSGLSASSSSLSSTSNANEVRHVDLLVFGYACKVFRDDAKARDIDQGKHLIPWMGDNNLKIDRYDVRGALYDLTPYEPPPGGYGNRLDYLTAEEQRAEQLCEEERYLFLYNNEEDVITKQEEELKRLQQETNGCSYSQVGFSYDQSQQIGPNREEFSNSPSCEEAEQAFQLPYNFQVPEGMQLPETMKQHAIIEKTARFIASQGVQMEILLKAKQSNNVQFEFLSRNSILNPYYKYVVSSIKDGTYPQHTEAKEKDPKESGDNANSNTLGSGTENVVLKPVVTVPTIKYKPSADCAYTQLISKIKGVPLSELHDESSRQSLNSQQESANNSPSLTPVLLQYNGATFVTEQDENSNSNTGQTKTTTDTLNDSQPKVEILKNSSALALAQNYSSDSETEEEEADEAEGEKTPPKLEFPLPPESLQNIIDKTAVYVIKNGRQFEETLRSKSVERFTFLLPDNEFYPYYMYKITGDPNAASKEQKKRKAKEVAEALLSKKGLSGDKSTATNPVSFSIKNKDETATNVSLQQPALPQEHSDDEDKPKTNASANSSQRHVPEHVQKAIQLVESQLMARNAQLAATLALRQTTPLANSGGSSGNSNLKSLSTRYDAEKLTTKLPTSSVTKLSTSSVAINTSSTSNTSKAEAERNALFEQQQQQRHKELKKAEEKVKDKLAQIAREKLGGLISKEKQLQLERKRKAMAFLNQIKGVSKTDNDSEADAVKKTKLSNNEDEGNNSDDSDASVHSIPITSYGPNSDDEVEEKLENKIITPTPPSPPLIPIKSKDLTLHKTPTVNVSDDDEVELISEIKPREIYSKRRSRSRSKDILITSTHSRRHYRKRTPSTESLLSSNDDDEEEEDREDDGRSHRSKSKSHKSKKSKSKKSSKSKKKSKKRSRSKSRTRSRSRSRSHHHSHYHSERYRQRSRSRSYNNHEEYYKPSHSERERDRDREQRKRSSHTPSRSHYSSSSSRSHKDKSRSHRYD